MNFLFFFTFLQKSFNVKFSDPIYTNLAPKTIEINSTVDQSGRISFYLNVKGDLRNAFVHILFVFDDDGQQNLAYSNKTINICSFLTNPRESVMLAIILNISKKFGEMPKRCPLKKVSVNRMMGYGNSYLRHGS